jgi:GR25 family glycosyltransferase involved in LPS biosynthesis
MFFKNLPIYYINLTKDSDRNNNTINNFKKNSIKIYKRIDAISITENINTGYTMTLNEIGCTLSHLKAIEEFYKSNNEYAMICEDDIDLSNSKRINFNFIEICKNYKNTPFCIQTSILYRLDYKPKFKINKRTFWDFSTASYIINKEYAKKIIDTYGTYKNVKWDSFNSKEVLDYRGGIINTRPVADELIYSLCSTDVVPLFSFFKTVSTVKNEREYDKQIVYSIKTFNNYWKNYKKITLKDISA